MAARKVVISGGFGFVGSNLVRLWQDEFPYDKILILDNLSSTADAKNLIGLDGKYAHACVDMRDVNAVQKTIELFQPDAVINCGSSFHFESFPMISKDFYEIDVIGTHNLLSSCRDVWGGRKKNCRFLQVSTDEVFGTLTDEDPPFTEKDRPDPRSAYATAKSASDQMVLAHFAAHGMDVVITHGSSTYGPNQQTPFLIPYAIRSALEGQIIKIPDASSIRDWIYVEDHCWGIIQTFEMGRAGARYCLSGNSELTNGEVVELTCAIFERLIDKLSAADIPMRLPLIQLSDEVTPDRRVIDNVAAKAEFGWEPEFPFDVALENTILWYINRFLGKVAFH